MSFFDFGSGYFSPPKQGQLARSPTSPFCTSPSQLQEVTLDQDGSLSNTTMGLRSPGGPMRGRSVKEFEDQLTNLKKENFNLKLRIYFLEEKMGINFTLDKDNIVKKNIELQVEVANLQKDVKEKHELLCQAVKAMELEDEEHKKYSQSKEGQIALLQQELEDLRLQVHDSSSRYDSVLTGATSNNNTSYSSRRSSNTRITELEERIKILECELQYERENNASLQLVIEQSQTIKHRYEILQKENDAKVETINQLRAELTSTNKRLTDFSEQIKEYEQKLSASQQDNQKLMKKMQSDQKKLEELHCQMTDISKKLTSAKCDLEKERKRLDRNKTINDVRINELENQNESYRHTINDLQSRLEAARADAKQNHNLAVSKSPALQTNLSHTDNHFILASDPATPDGTAKKDTLHVQVASYGSPTEVYPPSPLPPPSPERGFEVDQALGDQGGKLLTEYNYLKNANASLKQKVVDLKGKQIKACEIIKRMIDGRNKLDEEINQLKKKNAELEREMESVVSKPSNDRSEVGAKLTRSVSEMNITTAVSTPPCEKPMDHSTSEDNKIAEHYKALTTELEAKVEVLVQTLHEKDLQLQHIRAKYDEILNSLEEKENRIVDLEYDLLSNNDSKTEKSLLEKGDTGSEKHSSFFKLELEDKNREIEKLNEELKKCTSYLQEIVNKELWEKNREIEKMHQKQESTSEMIKLRKEISGKDMQLKILKEKISELGFNISISSELSADCKELSSPTKNVEHTRILQEQLKSARAEKEYFENKVKELQSPSQNGFCDKNVLEILKSENEKLQTELQKCEQLKIESNELCSVLGNRLEELAVFLDSLLKQKSVLGFLGFTKNKKLREIIDNTLDLSRSFTMNLVVNPEQSLAHLSNITDILNGSVFQDLTLNLNNDNGVIEEEEEDSHLSIVPSNITLTYRSHLHKKSSKDDGPDREEVIAALRQQIFNLKNELQLRDNELNRLGGKEFCQKQERTTETEEDREGSVWLMPTSPNKCNTSTTLKHQSDVQSESEAWSEPDRDVSRARIGLINTEHPGSKQSSQIYSNDSTEEESSMDRASPNMSKKRSSVIELHQQILELEDEVTRKSAELNRLESRSNLQYLENLEKQLEDTQGKLAQAEMAKAQAEEKSRSLQEAVDNLNVVKQQYEQCLANKDKEMQDKINELEVQKNKYMNQANDFEKQAMQSRNKVTALEHQVSSLSEEMKTVEEQLRRDYELATINKLKNAEEEFIRRVKKLQEKSETDIKAARDEMSALKEEYSNKYVKKCEVDQKLAEVEKLVSQLKDLKATVGSYEETVESYRVKEHEINNILQRYQDKVYNLRKELDESTLQYSEAVLEKTRLSNEKVMLEQELNRRNAEEMELQQQISATHMEITQINENYQHQLAALQKEKSSLEVKVSALESANAEIHNRLVRLQVSRHHDFNMSMPNLDGNSLHVGLYKRQCSDQNYNSSEDNADEIRVFNRNVNRPAFRRAAVDPPRHEANSSPDLGIESDHGRFSSLETQAHVPRPVLQTIELTESMNNLLDGEHIAVDSVSCAGEHCCDKSVQIVNENNELKRKLLRMKTALEETAKQLNLANQRKKQVEKTICKQIHKTSQVLRKAKANLDSGSESDVFKT